MAVWTTPTTRTTGNLVTAAIWNTDIVENLKYLKDAPVFDTAVIIGAATTSGVRLDLESGVLAVREGDDSTYAPAIASVYNLPSGGSINFASGDVTITHSTNTLTFGGASNGYSFDSVVKANTAGAVTSGFIDILNGAGWDVIGYVDATSSLAIGGYRSSQWAELRFYTSGTERARMTSGGNLAIGATAKFYLDGVAGTGDTYQEESAANVYQVVVGGIPKIRAAQTGISVSTSATTIIDDAGGVGSVTVVNGNDGSNRFCDLVFASQDASPTVIASYSALASPAARTYSRSGTALRLAMASGTYSVHTLKLGT